MLQSPDMDEDEHKLLGEWQKTVGGDIERSEKPPRIRTEHGNTTSQDLKWDAASGTEIPVGKPYARFQTPQGSQDYAKTLLLAARASGVDPERVKKGDITTEEAEAILKRMAPMNIWSLLMGGGAANVPKIDKEGNVVK
jgi:hypothetical protein